MAYQSASSREEREEIIKVYSIHFSSSSFYSMSFINNAGDEDDESRDHFTPRNYTDPRWSSMLSVDNFNTISPYNVRPFHFNSPILHLTSSSISQVFIPSPTEDHVYNRMWSWRGELFTKGVLFQKCILVGLWRNLEVQYISILSSMYYTI